MRSYLKKQGPSGKIKKTFRLNPSLIEEVRQILSTKTETETIEKALQEVLFKNKISQWIDNTSGKYPHL